MMPNTNPAESAHSPLRRFIERFALIAFGLYHLPLFLNNYPSLGGGGFDDKGLSVMWGHVFTPPGIWVARNVFHVTGAMNGATQGDNGDVSEEYGRLLLAVVIGLLGAMIWTIADRRRPRASWVPESLRVMLRYSIALGITSYGIAKILPMQFPPISASVLEQHVGDLTPMSLLWTFMQYSRPYAWLGGAMEMAAVVLLCFRRTTTLGSIVCLIVMANVAILNYAYGVPVKLYATMIVLSAVVLLLYDTPRLLRFFVQNKSVEAAPNDSVFHDRIPMPARWAVKIVLVGSVCISSWVAMKPAVDSRAVISPYDGAWMVTSFTRDAIATNAIATNANATSANAPGANIPDANIDSLAWRKLVVQQGGMSIQLRSDARVFCRQTVPTDSSNVALTCSGNRKASLKRIREGNDLRLDGTFDGAPIKVLARRRNEADYTLLRGKFRWFFE